LISAEAMMSGTVPIMIAQPGYSLYPWSNWMPRSFGFRFNSFEDFMLQRDELLAKDYSYKATLESSWLKAFHNQANFIYQLDKLLSTN